MYEGLLMRKRADMLRPKPRIRGRKRKNKYRAAIVDTFSDYQRIVEKTDERKKTIISLLGLVGEVGDLHSMIKKLMLQKEAPAFREQLREEFGDLLWYLTSLASLYRIPLQEIAQENARKAESLYLVGAASKFDRKYPTDEQLPRRFQVAFFEKPLKQGLYVRITVNGVVIGDALTDNAHTDDGYRFHDVFHFAYAAVLGWSPVVRGMLRRKRKSNPRIDEVEDGARAAIVEEAIAIFIFNQGESGARYHEESSVDLGLLKMVKRLSEGLEVQACTAKQWRSAIVQGFRVFSELRLHNGGVVNVDLDKQSVTYV
jgi:NTP pyrophosphatase (non-canonical NTP hydrolase)